LSLVFDVIGSMPMPICNCFHERLANNSKITTFTRGPRFDAFMRSFLEPRILRHRPLKSTFNAKNFTSSFYVSISIHFGAIWNVSRSQKSPKTKNPYFGIQRHPKSLNSVAILSQCTTSY